MIEQRITILIMSGVEDGSVLEFASDVDGVNNDQGWHLSIGRRDDNDIVLRNDTFVSRRHATLIQRNALWILEDHDSTNGTYTENDDDVFTDERVVGKINIEENQLFRVGRTWLRIQVVN